MTEPTVDHVDADRIDDTTPPPGTAIVRPLRHVMAVRERYLQRFTDPAQAATSRSARAWAWALGETAIAPVTDHETAGPPSRSEIEAQLVAADERRLCGDRENRADAAATVLRWLIGEDDHVPVRGQNLGELVGGSGDVVRSREQIADILTLAVGSQRRAAMKDLRHGRDPANKRLAQQDASYLDGVVATLTWVLGERTEAPITHVHHGRLTTNILKAERVYAEDAIELSKMQRMTAWLDSTRYGQGVTASVSWLLGDATRHP